MSALNEIPVSDIFFKEETGEWIYKESPDSLELRSFDPELEPELAELREMLLSASSKSVTTDFRVDFNGIRFRVERMTTLNGSVFVLRRTVSVLNTMSALGVPPAIEKELLSPEIRNGLIVFIGRFGSGKTTTASAFIAQRLAELGGTAWTLENPVETPLDGKHGKGICYQREVQRDEDFGPAIRQVLRASPNLILIGEIRDAAAAKEALHAGNLGSIVVATLHANDLQGGLHRLSVLFGGSSYLADSLRAAFYLRLMITDKPLSNQPIPKGLSQSNPPRVLRIDPLIIKDDDASKSIRTVIRNGDFHMLENVIESQRRRFMTSSLARQLP